MLQKLLLYYHTLKHLKLTQMYYYIIRRALPLRKVSITKQYGTQTALSLEPPISIEGIYQGANNEFRFLNYTANLGDNKLDWNAESMQRLWGYNLHYFDYLRENERPNSNKCWLIMNWIKSNPQGTEPGWEPFTTSLRIVNWVFYLNANPDKVTKEMLECLFLQTLWLEKNDEKHILANHYFENMKALFFASRFFTGKDAKRWEKKSRRLIEKQIKEQFDEDGVHYERSVQYHGLMLENLLDIFNICKANARQEDSKLLSEVEKNSKLALIFYEDMHFPDGLPALLGDTAFNTCPPLTKVADYYQRLTECHNTGECPTNPRTISYDTAGLFGYRFKHDMLLITAGNISPQYQPGHAHCDKLSYELMVDGQRIVVDSGVNEYEPGALRSYCRSTSAHNTIQVDNLEQSEIWGEFRVARRAKILNSEAAFNSKPRVPLNFSGGLEGFHSRSGTFKHIRHISLITEESNRIETLSILDKVQGHGLHTIKNRINLHPLASISTRLKNQLVVNIKDGPTLHIKIDADVEFTIKESQYCPEFGTIEESKQVVLCKATQLPTSMSYEIRVENSTD